MRTLFVDDTITENIYFGIERRRYQRRQTPDRRLFQRFEPGKITADRRKSLSDRRECETIGKLELI